MVRDGRAQHLLLDRYYVLQYSLPQGHGQKALAPTTLKFVVWEAAAAAGVEETALDRIVALAAAQVVMRKNL
jgi:hypothetical protein